MSRKSSSTDETPIAASISSRSASVSESWLTARRGTACTPSASSRLSTSDGSESRIRISQPSPYGSSFTVSGASTTFWFTSRISPESGAITSETAFTDSTSP